MKIYAPGIDLGKTVFHLEGLDECGEIVIRKRGSRSSVARPTAIKTKAYESDSSRKPGT
jgi:hypothetical protein